MAKAKPTSAGADHTLYAEPNPTASSTSVGVGREKTLATVTHVLGLLTLFVGPLVMYFLFRRKASPWLRDHLNEAVNYHILLVAAFILVVLGLAFLSQVNWAMMAFVLLLLLVFAAHVVFGLIAIIWAARGKKYHFPLDVKLVR